VAHLRLALLGCACACLVACSSKTSSQPTASLEATAASTAAALATAAPVLPRTVIFTCGVGHAGSSTIGPGEAVPRPSDIVLTCADAGISLIRLAWRDWGAARAVAAGIRRQNDCEPDCADGHFHNYPARVVAYAPGIVAGRRAYTRLEVTTVGRHPSNIKTVEVWSLTATGPQ